MVSLVAAIVAALAASASFAVSAVLEQRAARQVPQRRMLDPRLLADLIRYRAWLLSIVATAAGFALQVVALHFGPLALVQPILVCDLVFVVLLTAWLRRRRPDRTILAGVGCCAAGIAVFLAVAQPTGGTESVSLVSAIPLAAGLGAVLVGCAVWARRGPAETRQLAFALACGVCYGVNAFLIKVVTFSLGHGFSEPLTQWPLYALVIVGPLGFLLNQEAYQRGPLIAPALAVITAADPLVSIAIAALWLDESIANTPGALAAEVTSMAVMITGIALLAHRAPVLAREAAASEQAEGPQTKGPRTARPPAGRPPARRPAAAACAAGAAGAGGTREKQRVRKEFSERRLSSNPVVAGVLLQAARTAAGAPRQPCPTRPWPFMGLWSQPLRPCVTYRDKGPDGRVVGNAPGARQGRRPWGPPEPVTSCATGSAGDAWYRSAGHPGGRAERLGDLDRSATEVGPRGRPR